MFKHMRLLFNVYSITKNTVISLEMSTNYAMVILLSLLTIQKLASNPIFNLIQNNFMGDPLKISHNNKTSSKQKEM